MDAAEKLFDSLNQARLSNGGTLPRELWLATARKWIETLKREKKRAGVAEEAEVIYSAYPRKVAKLEALTAITKALQNTDAETLLKATKAYAAAVSRWPKDRHQFIPMPATWFNGGRYMDDPATWNEGFRAGHAPRPEDTEQLPEPARYEEWFRGHYEKEPRRWESLDREAQTYYLKLMRQAGLLSESGPRPLPAEAVAEMLAAAFKPE